MKKLVCVILLSMWASIVQGDTIVSQLGDEDGFGSYQPGIDDMTRSVMIEDLLALNLGVSEMDIYRENWDKGWTHYFTIPDSQTIASAILRIGIVESGAHLGNDYRIDKSLVVLDPDLPSGWGAGPSVMISQQPGYVRPPAFTTVEFLIDLSQVIFNEGWGDNLGSAFTASVLDSLNDGEFNIWGLADAGVDYSVLTIETIPEPASLSLLALGSLTTFYRRKRK